MKLTDISKVHVVMKDGKPIWASNDKMVAHKHAAEQSAEQSAEEVWGIPFHPELPPKWQMVQD